MALAEARAADACERNGPLNEITAPPGFDVYYMSGHADPGMGGIRPVPG
jgi:hypothetical protein